MRIEDQVGIALLLDLLIGDPRWLPHPVRLIGTLAIHLEEPLRRRIRNARLAGVAAAFLVVTSAGGAAWLLLHIAGGIAAIARDIVSIVLLYTCFAARDLAAHALAVWRALKKDDLGESRRLASRMVGRDTAELNEKGVARAVVESVAENTGMASRRRFSLRCWEGRWRPSSTKRRARWIPPSAPRMSAICTLAGHRRGWTMRWPGFRPGWRCR